MKREDFSEAMAGGALIAIIIIVIGLAIFGCTRQPAIYKVVDQETVAVSKRPIIYNVVFSDGFIQIISRNYNFEVTDTIYKRTER